MTVNIQRTLTPFTDLDDVFELRIAGDPIAGATGILYWNGSAWVDLNQRYCPLSIGSAIATNTGIQRVGTTTDLRSIFAGKGTVGRINTPWDGQPYSAFRDTDLVPNPRLVFTLSNTGNFFITGDGQGTEPTGDPLTGTWLGIGAASDYQVRYTVTTQTGSPVITNGASTFQTLSSSREIELEETTGSAFINVTVEFRRVGQTTVISTSTFSFSLTDNTGGGPIG